MPSSRRSASVPSARRRRESDNDRSGNALSASSARRGSVPRRRRSRRPRRRRRRGRPQRPPRRLLLCLRSPSLLRQLVTLASSPVNRPQQPAVRPLLLAVAFPSITPGQPLLEQLRHRRSARQRLGPSLLATFSVHLPIPPRVGHPMG